MRTKFTHLHVHTTMSILDGISRREDIAKKAKEYGQDAVAITEHGNLFNAVSWYKTCSEVGIKPIVGLEAYVSPDCHLNRTYATKAEAAEDAKNGDLSMSAYHLTILAKNRDGLDNLKRLSTLSWREGFYRKPRICDSTLMAHKEGLIVLSGCLAGKIARLIIAGNKVKALEEVDKMRAVFGDDFFLEVMNHSIPDEAVVVEALKDFAQLRGVGLVMTGDSHFTEHGDEVAHEVALAIGTNRTMTDPNRWKFNGEGYWFKSAEEMSKAAMLAGIPSSALDNTVNISSRVQDYGFKLVSKTKNFLVPQFNSGGRTLTDQECIQLLELKCMTGMIERRLAGLPEYQKRLEFELDIIKRKGFSSYFLIIADIVDFMRSKGMPISPGRGSAGSSLVCYSLFITGLDPIKLGMPFSRFINEGRKDLPDIDTDISQDRRHEVIQYIVSKYGADRVAHIATFQTMGAKGAMDNVGRALSVPAQIRQNVSRTIGEIEKEDKLVEVLSTNKIASEMMNQIPDWVRISERLEGNVRNTGAHAAGIVIANEPIINYLPLMKDAEDKLLVTQYDMKDVAELGLLKLDMLGLRTLDIIHNSITYVKANHGVYIDFTNMPIWDEPATYKTIADGKFVSVFQYDSSGMRSASRALRPENFDHLMALNALYRPGPMKKPEGGGQSMMEQYIERRHGRQAVEQMSPLLDGQFANTYGLCIYQEQLMKLSQTVAGFSEDEADDFRSSVGKKDKVKYTQAIDKFIERAVALGRPRDQVVDLANKLEGFARYGWNISHAGMYSYLSFTTAYLETHYPLEYYAALLNSFIGDTDKLKNTLAMIIQKNVKVNTPDINISNESFSTDGKELYMGLSSINSVGANVLSNLMEERKYGPFKDYIDFHVRTAKRGQINKLVKENLVRAGVFKFDTSLNDNTKLKNVEVLQLTAKKFVGILSNDETREELMTKIVQHPEFTDTEKLANERAVLNFFISSHPVLLFQKVLSLFNGLSFVYPSQLQEQMLGTTINVLGAVETKEIRTTKNGDPFLKMQVGDHAGNISVNVWSPLATKVAPNLVDNQLVILTGKVVADRFRTGDNLLSVSGVTPIQSNQGLGIESFYTRNRDVARAVCEILQVEPASVSDYVMNMGHIVILKSKAYITPDVADKLQRYRSEFTFQIKL